MMNTSDFIQRWLDYAVRYTDWYAPVKKFEKDYKKEHNLTWGDYEQIGEAVRTFQAQYRENDDFPSEIYAFIDQNCEIYLKATSEERAEIRAIPESNKDFYQIVWGYIGRAIRQLADTGDAVWLTRGLVMISIENMSRDFRDTLLKIASLYVEAEKHGISPRSVLTAIAKVSSQEKPRGGETSMSETLQRFHSYGVLREARRGIT
jgi:hypothetical protein